MLRGIAVIGRGVAGLAAAFRLAASGARVAVVGPRAVLGSATVVAQGLMVNKGLILARDPLYKMKLNGHRLLEGWLNSIDKVADGPPIPRVFAGAIEPFWSETEYRFLRQRIYKNNFDGFTACRVLDRTELLEIAAARYARSNAIGAFYYPYDGWFDPQATLASLERALPRMGVAIHEAPCLRIECAADHFILHRQDADPLAVQDVIIAAGYFSQMIMQNSGLPTQMLRAVLGLNLRRTQFDHSEGQIPLVHARHSLVTTQTAQILGSTSKPLAWSMPDQADLQTSQAQLVTAAARFVRLSPDDLAAYEQQWGIRLNAHDRKPLIGFLPMGNGKRLGFLTGLYKNGLQLADLGARYLRDAYLGAPTSGDLAALTPERFLK